MPRYVPRLADTRAPVRRPPAATARPRSVRPGSGT